MEKPGMEFVRIPREEQVFDRDEVLGRDASSVFPTESKAPALDSATVNQMLGSNLRFITESELEAIKAERGGRVEDGAVAPEKPLVEVLREAKEAKEAAFQAMWKTMKTGKNRALDEEELRFIDAVEQQRRLKDRSAREEEAAALDAYQQAVREAAEQRVKSGEEVGPAPRPSSKAEDRRPTAKRKPVVPLVRVKPAPKQPSQVQSRAELDAGDKRPRAGQQKGGGVQSNALGCGEGLEAFLGEYGSDSDN